MSPCHSSARQPTTRLIPVATVVALLASVSSGLAQSRDPYAAARLKMVEDDLVREGIKNESLLRAMRSVPRHLFCAPEWRASAYFDQALPIGHKETISSPFIVAYMTGTLDPQPDDKVLEIGTGSGYQAAVLSGLVREVYTIEIIEALGKSAAELLKQQGYRNVFPRIGDGYRGWPEHAPFDKIIVTCSPENVPKPLIDQLREGGRMLVPLGQGYDQVFYLFEKRDGELVKTKLIPTAFVPMTGISDASRKTPPDPARPALHNGGFEEEENGQLKNWYYLRQVTRENGEAPEGKSFVTFTNREPGRGAMALQAFAVDGTQVCQGKKLMRRPRHWPSSAECRAGHFRGPSSRPK